MKIDLIDFIKQDLKEMSEADNYTFLYDCYCDLDNHIKQFLKQQLNRINHERRKKGNESNN